MHQAEIAALIRTLSTGIYGVGVHHHEEDRIFTASWIMPVSFNPVLIALSINPHHRSYQMLKKSGVFSVNVIGQDHAELADKLAGPGDRLQGLEWFKGITSCPLLKCAIAHLECRVEQEYPAGDHQLIVGALMGGSILKPHTQRLLYAETGNLDGSIALFPEHLPGSIPESTKTRDELTDQWGPPINEA